MMRLHRSCLNYSNAAIINCMICHDRTDGVVKKKIESPREMGGFHRH